MSCPRAPLLGRFECPRRDDQKHVVMLSIRCSALTFMRGFLVCVLLFVPRRPGEKDGKDYHFTDRYGRLSHPPSMSTSITTSQSCLLWDVALLCPHAHDVVWAWIHSSCHALFSTQWLRCLVCTTMRGVDGLWCASHMYSPPCLHLYSRPHAETAGRVRTRPCSSRWLRSARQWQP